MTDTIEHSEAEKYEAVWAHHDYRRTSPGEQIVDHAAVTLKLEFGDSLIDFGCGTGRATNLFHQIGVDATGVDIARNALDKGVSAPFVRACLWDLPEGLIADYGFCVDVLEHIPTEKVPATIQNISRAVRKGCYFQVATRPDVYGKMLIGEPLHLTVKDKEWWTTQISGWFGDVTMLSWTAGVVRIVARN